MQRKPSLLVLVSAVFLAIAPNAPAAGLADQRVAPGRGPAPQPQRSSHGPIAPQSACPDQNVAGASPLVQRRAMLCMTDYARRSVGLAGLADARKLDRSADDKSGDILHCDSFSHFACGRDFTYWMRQSGYLSAPCWRAGENLAWGVGEASTAGAIFRAWMHSPGHRRNILGRFDQIGVGLRVGSLEESSEAHVWTQHFGSHCGASRS